jgi:hypothetical protein
MQQFLNVQPTGVISAEEDPYKIQCLYGHSVLTLLAACAYIPLLNMCVCDEFAAFISRKKDQDRLHKLNIKERCYYEDKYKGE